MQSSTTNIRSDLDLYVIDYLGNALRRIFILFRIINAIAASGRLIPKTIASAGIINVNFRPHKQHDFTTSNDYKTIVRPQTFVGVLSTSTI